MLGALPPHGPPGLVGRRGPQLGALHDEVVVGARAAAQALAQIVAARTIQPEALIKVHVLEDDRRLAGVVSVITLLHSEPVESVAALMDSDPVRVGADADLTDIALLMADFNLYSIPVVDDQDRVLGVVTVDDVLEATIPEDWRRREPAPAAASRGSRP